jgi:hypothetical protein
VLLGTVKSAEALCMHVDNIVALCDKLLEVYYWCTMSIYVNAGWSTERANTWAMLGWAIMPRLSQHPMRPTRSPLLLGGATLPCRVAICGQSCEVPHQEVCTDPRLRRQPFAGAVQDILLFMCRAVQQVAGSRAGSKRLMDLHLSATPPPPI